MDESQAEPMEMEPPVDYVAMHYWAKGDTSKLISKIVQQRALWATSQASTNVFTSVMAAYWRNMAAYYSPLINPDSWVSALGYAGEQGELVKLAVASARTLIEQSVTFTTKQRLSFETLTDINEAAPLQTARLGKAICNQVAEDERIDSKMENVAERCHVLGKAFMTCVWRSDRGYVYSRNEGDSVNYSGGVQWRVHDFHEVIYDWSIEDWDEVPCATFFVPMNRYDLMANYPEHAEAIKSAPSVKQELQASPNLSFMSRYEDTDLVYVKEFYHRPTPALPNGRMVVFLSATCVLLDHKNEEGNFMNPYGTIPGERFMFSRVMGTGLGYPLMSSLLPLNEMLDHEMSVISTNHQAFGVQSVLVPKGSDIGVEDVSKGLNFISYTPQNAEGGGKPEALQLTATPPEIMQFTDKLEHWLDIVSKMPSTLRGAPPSNVTSGEMAATISANALEFLSGASKVMTIGVEKLMNFSIQWYQRFADVEQIVNMVGKGEIASVKEFKAETIKSIKRIKIRTQSPMMNTVAGRMQFADGLMQKGLVDAFKYYNIIEGAPIEEMFDSELSENMSVQQEIDTLMDGGNVAPLLTDNHPIFIRAYRKLLYNQHVRLNSELKDHVLELIFQRVRLEETLQADPVLFQILRGQPSPMASMAPPPGEQAPTEETMPMQPSEPPVSDVSQPAEMPM
jgi:hypothetical protein